MTHLPERQPGVWVAPPSEAAVAFSGLLKGLGVVRTEVSALGADEERTGRIGTDLEWLLVELLELGDKRGLVRVGDNNDDILDLNPFPPQYRSLFHALARQVGQPVVYGEFCFESPFNEFIKALVVDASDVDGPFYPLVWRMRVNIQEQTCTLLPRSMAGRG